MKFQDALTTRERTSRGDHSWPERDFRIFNALPLRDGYVLSIQASETHYCTPRETLDDPELYYRMEIAICKDGLIPQDQLPLPEFYRSLWQDDTVAGYVDVNTIQEIYDLLREVPAYQPLPQTMTL